MRVLRVAFLIGSLFSLQACAAVALTFGGLAGGVGMDHTLNGIAYKTFAVPIRNLRLATLKALNQMAIDVTEDAKEETGWKIVAKATDRKIDIELEKLTSRATRMRVIVYKGGFFFKDRATGTEIINRTAETLDRQAPNRMSAR